MYQNKFLKDPLIFLTILSFIIWGIYLRLNWRVHSLYYSPDDMLRLLIAGGNSIQDIFIRNRYDVHAPLVYLILHFMMKVSSNELFLRSLSLVPGLLLVVSLYWLGKKLHGDAGGVFMSFMGAFGVGLVIQSQVLRQYALSVFLLSLTFLVFSYLYERGKKKYLITYFILSFLTVFSHYPMAIVIFAMFLVYLLKILTSSPFSQVASPSKRNDVKLPISPRSDALVILESGIKLNNKKQVFTWIAGHMPILIFLVISFLYQGSQQWAYNSPQLKAARDDWLTGGFPTNLSEYVQNTINIISFFSVGNVFFTSVFLVMILLGLAILYKKKEMDYVLIFVISLVINIVLSITKRYPYSGTRHSLHLLIPTLIVAGASFRYLRKFLVHITKKVQPLAILRNWLFLLIIANLSCFLVVLHVASTRIYYEGILAATEFPILRKDLNTTLKFIQDNISRDDVIVTDFQTALYFMHWSNKHTNNSISDSVGVTAFRDNQVYFNRSFAFAYTLDEYKEIYEKILVDENLHDVDKVWIISMGWRGMQINNSDLFLNPEYKDYFLKSLILESKNHGRIVIYSIKIQDFKKIFS